MQTVYQYNNKGYYAGETQAYNGMPHNTTDKKPSLKVGFVPRWTGAKWEQAEDHKGEKGYVDGVYTEIKDYGALPAGWTTEAPKPDPGEARKAEIISELSRLDTLSIRPLRAIADGKATDEDRQKLDEIERQAALLRDELGGL